MSKQESMSSIVLRHDYINAEELEIFLNDCYADERRLSNQKEVAQWERNHQSKMNKALLEDSEFELLKQVLVQKVGHLGEQKFAVRKYIEVLPVQEDIEKG